MPFELPRHTASWFLDHEVEIIVEERARHARRVGAQRSLFRALTCQHALEQPQRVVPEQEFDLIAPDRIALPERQVKIMKAYAASFARETQPRFRRVLATKALTHGRQRATLGVA
jgi:hypothetical protein